MGEARRKRRATLPGDAKGTYADKLTIDEYAANDLEMVKEAIENANKYTFGQDKVKALRFIKLCMDATLKRLGITVQPPTSAAERLEYAVTLDKAMRQRQIRIENRNRYQGADIWRCGLYIYQRDELVAFISDVLTERRTEADPITMKILREDIGCMVITNANLEDAKKFFVMPGKPSGIVDLHGKPMQAQN